MLRRITLIVLLAPFACAWAQQDLDLTSATIMELQEALTAGEISSVQLVQGYLARIDAYDRQGPRLNSLVRVNPQALSIAAALDSERAGNGPRGPLHGIPLIVKDNYNTTDLPTTGGSVALAGFLPSANATQVDLLVRAGAIILAKSNLHEFAYGITSVGSLVGQTRNPYDPRRAPGGSSGGTGAAVAASFAAAGMGSDTCGSIRIPAAFNNLVGLRPSKGLSSIYGVMPLSHTQDVAGPLARNIPDLALVLDAVVGYDPRDPATGILEGQPVPEFTAALGTASLTNVRIGRLVSYIERADPAVQRVIESKLEQLELAGVTLVDVEIPGLGEMIGSSGLIGHEFRNDLNAYFEEFGSDRIATLAEIVDAGLFHTAVTGPLTRSRNNDFDAGAYNEAYGNRAILRESVERVFTEQQLDAVVYPPIGELPVFIGESQPGNNCSIAANAGLPAISLPAGFSPDGLPVGMELLGTFLSDTRLVALAYSIEQLATERRNPFTTPPLRNGSAPGPRSAVFSLGSGRLQARGEFVYRETTGMLNFQVENVGAAPEDLTALVLVIDAPPLQTLNDPAVHNLLAPGVMQNAGELFATPALREAIADGRVYLRIFGTGLPVEGITELLQFQ